MKGACKNCGAMGHTAKDCVERPRSNKKTAEKTGLDIAPDDIRTDLTSHGKVRGIRSVFTCTLPVYRLTN